MKNHIAIDIALNDWGGYQTSSTRRNAQRRAWSGTLQSKYDYCSWLSHLLL